MQKLRPGFAWSNFGRTAVELVESWIENHSESEGSFEIPANCAESARFLRGDALEQRFHGDARPEHGSHHDSTEGCEGDQQALCEGTAFVHGCVSRLWAVVSAVTSAKRHSNRGRARGKSSRETQLEPSASVSYVELEYVARACS